MTQTYHAVTVELPAAAVEQGEAILYEHGALGLELRDTDTRPLPGVRAPAKGGALLIASFGSKLEADAAHSAVLEELPGAQVSVEAVETKDWSVAWREQIRATVVGRLWVGPPWQVAAAPADKVRVVVEPKMAFGTGDHPTTALCLQALDDFLAARPGATVLDVGTGTGVLAIAARKLGAGRVVGVDNDPVSVELAGECAAENAVPELELSGKSLGELQGPFDLVVANILANTLIELAPQLAALAKERLLLSGVLVHQADQVSSAFLQAGMKRAGSQTQGEWIRLDFEPG